MRCDVTLLPDAHGLCEFVELGGDQAVEELAIGDRCRRLSDGLLQARDFREGCAVFVQILEIAGQKISALAGFRGGEFGEQLLGLLDDVAGLFGAVDGAAKGQAVEEGVNGDPDHDDHGNRQPQIVGGSRHRESGCFLIHRVSAGHCRLKGFEKSGFDTLGFPGPTMILAIDIGGTKFSMAVFDGDVMVRRESRATDAGGGRQWMVAQIGEIVGGWRREFALEGCGIGFGGPVNFAAQRVVLSTHVGGWRDFDLCGFVREAAGVPAIMDNDANVGAMGEAEFGAGRGCSPLFYMTLSTGIGGGIWEDGRIWRGADSYGGEIGHLTIRPDGPECLCGARGCLERMCCGLWLERDHGKSARELMQDAEFVKGYVVDLALGLKAAIMLLNPQRIVIGGGISKAGDRLFGPLRQELRRQITSWSAARIDVEAAALGDDSVLYGALALARRGGGA